MFRYLISLPDGRELFSGPEQVNAVQSVTLTQCVNSAEELTPGSVCAAMLEVTAITPRGGLELTAGDEVTLFRVDAAGAREQVGVFILEKPTRPTANTMKITGYDRVIGLDQDLTGWLGGLAGWPYRLLDLAKMVCAQCGLTLKNESIPNGDLFVAPFSAEATGRQLMEWIGQVCCRFCRAAPDGELELAWYTPSGISVTPSGACYYFRDGLTYEDYRVQPVDTVQLRLGDSTDGALWPGAEENANSYVIEGNPILCLRVSDELLPVLQVIKQELPAEGYTPCKMELPACPQLRAGDTLQVTDSNGVTFTALVMTKVSSGQRDTLECTGGVRRDSPGVQNNKSPAQKLRQLELAIKSVDGEKVVSMINLSEDGVKIQGNKIRLEGTVTANEGFKVLTDGSIEATAGRIGGCEIKDGKLVIPAGHIEGELTVGQLPEVVAQKGDIPAVPTALSAFINDSGYQTRSNVVSIIDGVVNADFVNALGIAAAKLTVTDRNGSTLLSAGDGAVQLGGWNIDDNSLYSTWADSSKRIFISTGTANQHTVGGYTDRWYIGAGSSAGNGFGVSTSGVMCASGAKISGEIRAKKGDVGGWEIGEYGLSANGSYITTNGSFGFCPNGYNYVAFQEENGDSNTPVWDFKLGQSTRLRIGDTSITEADLKKLLTLIQ